MTRTNTLLAFLLAFLLSNCASKETFMFSNLPAGPGVQQKVRPAGNVIQAGNATATENSAQGKRSVPDSVFLTASTAPLALPKGAVFPQKVLSSDFKTNTPSKIPVSKLALSPAKILKLQKAVRKQLKNRPDVKAKPINELASFGLILGLAAVSLLILAGVTQVALFTVLAFFVAIGGLITSVIGLKEIKRNPDQYAGQVTAIAGVVISSALLLFFLFFILYILAYAGTF